MASHNISTISIRTTKHSKQTFPANFTTPRCGTVKNCPPQLRGTGQRQPSSPRGEGARRALRGRQGGSRGKGTEPGRASECTGTAAGPGKAPHPASRSACPALPGLTSRAGSSRATNHKPPGPTAATGPSRSGPGRRCPPHLVLDELFGAGVTVAEPRDGPRLERVTTELGVAPAGPCPCRYRRALPAARGRRRGGGRRHRRLHRRTRN